MTQNQAIAFKNLSFFQKIKYSFSNRNILVSLMLGFSSGLPLLLIGGTLQAWLTKSGLSLSTVGAFTLVGLPYTLKFLWAPFLDRYSFFVLGKRRGWLLFFQVILAISIFVIGRSDPTQHLESLAILSVVIAFFSASQDIVVDALRTEIVSQDEMGPAAGNYVSGYRIALIVAGAGALMMAEHVPWSGIYTIMSCLMLIGIIATWIAPEPKEFKAVAMTAGEAFVKPLVDYFSRSYSVQIALFIVLYKFGDSMLGTLSTPFLIKTGYKLDQIGLFSKFIGGGATILGATLGGILMLRLNMRNSLILFGIFQAISNFAYSVLATLPIDPLYLASVIFTENFCGGLGTAAFTAFLMRLCNKNEVTGQYAVLSSFMAIPRVMLGPVAGQLAEALGWNTFFLITVVAAVPGTLMLLKFNQWMSSEVAEGQFIIDENNKVKPSTIFAFIGFLILFFATPMYLDHKFGQTVPMLIMGAAGLSMLILSLWSQRKDRIKNYKTSVFVIMLTILVLYFGLNYKKKLEEFRELPLTAPTSVPAVVTSPSPSPSLGASPSQTK